jgi:hypothetical protein
LVGLVSGATAAADVLQRPEHGGGDRDQRDRRTAGRHRERKTVDARPLGSQPQHRSALAAFWAGGNQKNVRK